jgi:hypothetical protein
VPPQSPRRPWPRFILLFALLACAVMPADGFARASGGYSRPGGYSRTPSLGSGGGYRTPSTSGGYSRPSPPYVRPPPSKVPQSPGDRSFPKTDPAPRLNATARNRMRLGASASTRQLRLVRRPQIHPTSTRPVSTDQPPSRSVCLAQPARLVTTAANVLWRQSQLRIVERTVPPGAAEQSRTTGID